MILLLIARKLTLEYDQMRVTSRIPKNYKKCFKKNYIHHIKTKIRHIKNYLRRIKTKQQQAPNEQHGKRTTQKAAIAPRTIPAIAPPDSPPLSSSSSSPPPRSSSPPPRSSSPPPRSSSPLSGALLPDKIDKVTFLTRDLAQWLRVAERDI